MPIRLLFIFLLTSSVAVVGQTQPQELPPVCNDEYARFLVDQQVAESKSVQETDRRVRILIRAADFLWMYDQPTAREYFAEAFKVAGDRFNEKGFEKEELAKSSFRVHPDHRFEVIRAIMVKDGEWAKRLVDQLMKEYEKAAKERTGFDKTSELDDVIRMAVDSLKTNPELSRQLFRRAMQHPLDFHWMWAPLSAAATNRQFADELYAELLANYANATPRRLLLLSAYPFASARIIGLEKYQFGAFVPESLQPNRNLQQRFIDTFLRRAISYAADPQNINAPAEENRMPEPAYVMTALNELEPIIIRDFPSLIQRLSEARAQTNGLITEQLRKDVHDRETRNEELNYGFDRRLKQLEEAEAKGRLTDFMIVQLLTWGEKGKSEEQFEVIEPWLDKIKEADARQGAINYFWFLRSQLAIREARYDDAEKFARKVPELEHRAILFFEIADKQLKNVNDAATVYSTLREVGRIAEQADNSVEKVRVLLALVNKYSKVNAVFAMQELSDAVRVLNGLEKPQVLSGYITRVIKGKDFSSTASFSMPGYDFETTFREISKNNFELSLSNAKSVDDKYLRALAVFAIAKNCAEAAKKKPAGKAAPPKAGS
ncbi:MAG TPA: hypothetical protein VNA22_09010 [Pyrinomonadaceae bacterium]|nr:hypothetical protein [Pyrinomonadaceae bacterium]